MFVRLGRLSVDWRLGQCLTLIWRGRRHLTSTCFIGGIVRHQTFPQGREVRG